MHLVMTRHLKMIQKMPLNPSNYKYWLKLTASYYSISQKSIINGRTNGKGNVWKAKQTFYNLLLKSNIDVYKTSKELGKNPKTIMKMLKTGSKKYRDKVAEIYLYQIACITEY